MDSRELIYIQARQLVEQRRYQEAIAAVGQLVEDPVFRISSLLLIGVCYARLGDFQTAISKLKEGLALVGDDDSDLAKEIRLEIRAIEG